MLRQLLVARTQAAGTAASAAAGGDASAAAVGDAAAAAGDAAGGAAGPGMSAAVSAAVGAAGKNGSTGNHMNGAAVAAGKLSLPLAGAAIGTPDEPVLGLQAAGACS